MRVLPLENEAINECWLSDKDRFSYEGLNTTERLTQPMIKQGGEWAGSRLADALEYRGARAASDVARATARDAIGALATPHRTLEELYLLQKLMRGLGSDNVDLRLRQSRLLRRRQRRYRRGSGMTVAELDELDRVLVVGCTCARTSRCSRTRLRQAAKQGAQLSVVHAGRRRPADARCGPSRSSRRRDCGDALAEVVRPPSRAEERRPRTGAASQCAGDGRAQAIAASLCRGRQRRRSCSATLRSSIRRLRSCTRWRSEIAQLTGAQLGFLARPPTASAAISRGACRRQAGGLECRAACWPQPRKAYLLLGVEPELDCADPRQRWPRWRRREFVVVLSPFKRSDARIMPMCCCRSRRSPRPPAPSSTPKAACRASTAVVQPLGETRPAWKVLRVLGNLLGLPGFELRAAPKRCAPRRCRASMSLRALTTSRAP